MNTKELIEEGKDLLEELKIDDSSLHTLNEELKRQSLLQVEFLLLLRHAKIRMNKLLLAEEEYTSKKISETCKEAFENGKPIASSAKKDLKKTDLPLDPYYMKIRKNLLEANEETDFLESLQYILKQRGDLLIELIKLDRNRVLSEAMLNTDMGMKTRINVYNKKMMKMIEKEKAKNEGNTKRGN